MSVICDLVLLSWNHLEETKPCLESLFRTTDIPSRLIIVDNGSEAPVRQFLTGVRPSGAIQEVVLLQNEANLGFPGGMNRGMRESRAPYVCLLNNDLVFTPGWLGRMIAVVQAHPEVGIVNPASSTFGQFPPAGMPMDEYAGSLAANHDRYVEVGMCIGFCMLITREVVERLGVLTEEVERIFFEDEDYCMRAQTAGWRCAVAHASYVHHAEHRTVQKMGERERLFSRNKSWCEAKWGPWRRVAYPRFNDVKSGSPELRLWLERLVAIARRRTHVYAYGPVSVGRDEAFRSVGLVPHADVLWKPIPGLLPRLMAAGAILGRRKKPFDAIVAPDDGWAAWMRRLRWAHRAHVVPASQPEQLESLWRTPVPSLSSS